MALFLCFSSFTAVSASDTASGSTNLIYAETNVLAYKNPKDENDFLSYLPFSVGNSALYCVDSSWDKNVLANETTGAIALISNSNDKTVRPVVYNYLQSQYSYTPTDNATPAFAGTSNSSIKSIANSIQNSVSYTFTDDDLKIATEWAIHIIGGEISLDKLKEDSNTFVASALAGSTSYSGLPHNYSLSAQQAQNKKAAMLALVESVVLSFNASVEANSFKTVAWSDYSGFKKPYVYDKATIGLKLPTEFSGNTFEANVSGQTRIAQGSTTMIYAMPGCPALTNITSLFPSNSGITNAVITWAGQSCSEIADAGDGSKGLEMKPSKITFTVDRNRYTNWLLSDPTVTVPETQLDNAYYLDPADSFHDQLFNSIDYQDMLYVKMTPFKAPLFIVNVPDFSTEVTLTKTIAGTSGTPLAGVTIALFGPDGQRVYENMKGETLNLTTNAEGKINIKDIPLGVYRYQEVSVPAGYSLRADSYTFELTSTGAVVNPENTLSRLEFDNEKTKVYITKTDEGNTPLAGVRFKVYNSAGSEVGDKTTDSQGKIVFEGLTAGETYTLREVAAPTVNGVNYTKMEDISFTVKPLDTQQIDDGDEGNGVTAKNTKTEVYIKKADFADASPVAGATIEIKNNSGVVVFTGTSKADGDFGLKAGQLPVGKYTFKETVAPNGYKLNETTFSFEIKENGEIVSEAKTGDHELTITDEKLDITLLKLDSADDEPVAGVQVEVNDKAAPNAKVTLTSDAEGKLHFTVGDPFLKVGHEYEVVEKVAAPGYVLSDVKYTFKINNDGTITGNAAEIKNDPTHLELSKSEISTAAPVPGATLTIYTLDNEVAVTVKGVEATGVTDEAGKLTFDYLPVGKYYFLETDAPEGYVLNPEKHEFEILPNGETTGKSTMSDELNKVEFVKVDADTNEPLEGVEFKLFKDSDIKPKTKNILGDRLTLTTDKDGKLVLTGLEDGSYRLVEDEDKPLVDGYFLEITGDKAITFEVSREDGAHESTIKVDSTTIKNHQTKVELLKLDVDGEKGVAGVKIELIGSDGTVITKNALGEDLNLVSDENGKFEFNGLKVGAYDYREVEVPHGYTINQTKFNFRINNDGSVEGNLEFENSKTHVEIRKTDLTDSAPVEGATIEIYDEKGEKIAEYVSDKDGKLPIPDGTLAIGKYTFKETIAPEGYALNETVFEFEIKPDGKIVGATEIKDEKTHVILHKHDKMQDLPVEGALLEVYDKDGNLVTKYSKSYFTNKDGDVEIIGIPVGTYTWKEAVAPEGYILNKETKEFTIAPNGKVTGDLEMDNQPNEIIISKINSTKSTDKERVLVPGAEFQFWKDGKEFGNYTTDKNGQIKLVGVKPGKYTYKEIKAPVGFELKSDVYEFTVDASGKASGNFLPQNRETGMYLYKKSFTTGKALQGAVFSVKDSSGKEVATGTSDANGLVLIQTLKPGKYVIEETKSPEGYVITDAKYGFTINELGSVVEGDLTVYNKLDNKDGGKAVNTGFGGNIVGLGLTTIATLTGAAYIAIKRKKEND